jgi:ribose 5-phosphate isomerase B
MKIYFAADHAGLDLKNKVLVFARDVLGHEVEDCGAFIDNTNDDYPEIIAKAAQKLSDDARAGRESRAIIAGGSGQGEAMVANRYKGVRCGIYYGEGGTQTDAKGRSLDVIASMREHNNANALSLGARFISEEQAKEAVRRFLEIPFSKEDRHMRRIVQIDELSL